MGAIKNHMIELHDMMVNPEAYTLREVAKTTRIGTWTLVKDVLSRFFYHGRRWGYLPIRLRGEIRDVKEDAADYALGMFCTDGMWWEEQ